MYLLVSNGKFSLRLLVRLGKGLEPFDRLSLRYLHAEFHVCLGVFVARLEEVSIASVRPMMKQHT